MNVLPLLPIGEYTIRAESQGFQSVEQKDLRLQVDEHRELNFSLAPASVTDSNAALPSRRNSTRIGRLP